MYPPKTVCHSDVMVAAGMVNVLSLLILFGFSISVPTSTVQFFQKMIKWNENIVRRTEMTRGVRQSKFEILRILTTFAIVCFHIIVHGTFPSRTFGGG